MLSKQLITHYEPKSYASECFKMLRTNLNFINIDQEQKVFIVTSSTKDEGKSTTICNLAISYAQEGKKVLLVDCDLRKSTVHKMFGLPQIPGLTELLSNSKDGANAVKRLEDFKNLDVIPAGQFPPSPADLLGSKTTASFFEIIRSKYDVILLDTPPILHVTDAAVLSRFVDGVVLVVAEGESKKDAVVESVNAFRKVNANILGIIKTKVESSKKDYYYYHE